MLDKCFSRYERSEWAHNPLVPDGGLANEKREITHSEKEHKGMVSERCLEMCLMCGGGGGGEMVMDPHSGR